MKALVLIFALLLLAAAPSWADVAFDADDCYSGSSTGDLSWTHTPSGTPDGVLVLIGQSDDSEGDGVSTVTYGGNSMSEITNSPKQATGATEAISYLHGFFLGSSVPTGAQTVYVTSANGEELHACSFTVTTSSEDPEVNAVDVSIDSNVQSNPRATLGLNGKTSWVVIMAGSGMNTEDNIAPISPGWTQTYEFDSGSTSWGWYRYDTIGSTDVSCGWDQGTNDTHGMCVAINEGSGAAVTPKLTLMGVGP
jgi:hypothetical protein